MAAITKKQYLSLLKSQALTDDDKQIYNQYINLFNVNVRGIARIKDIFDPRYVNRDQRVIVFDQLRTLINQRQRGINPNVETDIYRLGIHYNSIKNIISILNRYTNSILKIEFIYNVVDDLINNEFVEETIIYRGNRNLTGKDVSNIMFTAQVDSDIQTAQQIRIKAFRTMDNRVENILNKSLVAVKNNNIEVNNNLKNYLLNQIFRNNESKTCFYDCIIKKIDSLLESDKSKTLKYDYERIKKKILYLKDDKGVKIYDEKFNNILELGISINIYNIITREYINYKNGSVKSFFSVDMVFSYNNHLDYLCNEPIIISNDEYKKMLSENNNYIDTGNKLYIEGLTYQKEIINEEYYEDYKNYFANINDNNKNIVQYLNNYNYNMHHTFLKTNNIYQSPLDNGLDGEFCVNYNYDLSNINLENMIQYDLSKAFYNVCYMPFYHGIPSKNLILHKLIDYDIEDFNKQLKNNIIGFYTIQITRIKDDRIKIFGFNDGSFHLLTSIMILLIIKYCDIKFLYGLYSMTDKTPLYINKHLEKIKLANNEEITKYKKYNGLFLKSYDENNIKIKSEYITSEFLKYCKKSEYDIYCYKTGDIKEYILRKEKKTFIYSSYVGYYIHSYVNYKIIDTIMKMKDIKNLYMVKMDCIVCHKSEEKIFDNYYINDTNKLLSKYNNDNLDELFNKGTIPECMFNLQIDNINDLNIPEINLGEDNFKYLNKNIIFCNGKGGSGKTYNICNSFNNILYISHCWSLCHNMRQTYKNISCAVTPHRIIEKANDKYYECEKIKSEMYSTIIIDELTLLDIGVINLLLEKFKNNFVFLIGDITIIDRIPFNYQAGINNICFGYDIYEHQIINYVKNYRFDDNLNKKLDILRNYMIDLFYDIKRIEKLKNIVKELFKDRLFNYEDIDFDKKTYGLVSINELDDKTSKRYYGDKINLTEYYNKKNNIFKYYIYKTDYKKSLLKGDYTDYEIKGISKNILFNTVHSFQGKTIEKEEKLIIDISKIFDYQVLYTALSRVKTEEQIYIIEYIKA